MGGRWWFGSVVCGLAIGVFRPCPGLSQESLRPGDGLRSAEGTARALYGALSFDVGGQPDWAFVRGLFLDEAVVVFAEGAGGAMRAMNPDAFIEDFQSFYADQRLVDRGFAETAEHVDVTEFGSLAQVFVVFQPRIGGRAVGRRGLDCLQLTRVDGRWWVTAIITDWEGPGQPIPDRALGRGAGN